MIKDLYVKLAYLKTYFMFNFAYPKELYMKNIPRKS
jgi:hypothetical protein